MGEERPAGRVDPQCRAVRFAAFELDVRAGELRKHGVKIRLQEQPFQVLLMLLERPGEVVLREEIRKKLWPNDTIVEFAPSINAAIQRLRDALGDSADQPRYVETVARRGYRFIGELASEEPSPGPAQLSDEEGIPDTSDLTGHTLSHYRVYEKLGRGGMGEVYRARDTKLGRDVALKVLPEEFARDADRMARFEREAQVLASLNHPNIAAIYGVEEANGIRALVMELVGGPTLAERIARGAIPLEEALGIARQMADALGAAHEKGIVHRDLKPANVKVTPEGVVKVLDFGLATVMQNSTPLPDNPENSRTRTATLSEAGVILGTAAYMAPEQARGEAVDKRTDIWAFGVVLYEMLTGKRLFEGETTTEILSSVLTQEPDWNQAPDKVQRLLRRCLEKDPKRRLRDVGEVPFLLEEAPQVGDSRYWSKLPWVVAAAFALIALATSLYFRRPAGVPRLLKLSVVPPEGAPFASSLIAVSPDGLRLAFIANSSLWVRDLDSLIAHLLSGTEGASNPFWSPDGRFIAFFAGGKLNRIDATNGPAQALCDADIGVGSWGENNTILFAQSLRGLFSVSAASDGATASKPFKVAGQKTDSDLAPWFLPDGHRFLYTDASEDVDKAGVYLSDLHSNTTRRVLVGARYAKYAGPGYLLYIRRHALIAQPFNPDKVQVTGEPQMIADQVGSFATEDSGIFSTSENGVLAYASGLVPKQQLTWFDRSGRAVGTVGKPELMDWATVSPDGNTIAIDRQHPGTEFFDVFLYDSKVGVLSRFTLGLKRYTDAPIWAPDGSHIAFAAGTDHEPFGLYQKETSRAAKEELLYRSERGTSPRDWSRDGRYIIFNQPDLKTKADIWVLPLFGDRKPFPYLQTEFGEENGKLSPDGRWLAYVSDETGRPEVYVQSFPTPGAKWQVSAEGGGFPVWSRDGKELFFVGDGKLMTAEVKGNAGIFEAVAPKALFNMPDAGFYDVSKDGRFLIPVPVEKAGSVPITVVVNWTAGLKK